MRKFFGTIVFLTLLTAVTFAQESIQVFPDGDVGINVYDATEKLEVGGNVKADGRVMDKWGFVMPVGTILCFALKTPPSGWLVCDGSVIDKSANPEFAPLVDALRASAGGVSNHPYIYGLNANQARLPDLRGDFLRGSKSIVNTAMTGLTPPVGARPNADPDAAQRTNPQTGTVIGDVVGSAQNDAIQTHSHSASISLSDGGPYGEFTGLSCIIISGYAQTYGVTVNSPTGSGVRVSANETRADNTQVIFIIKF
jgi:microcystin-dependent protein